MAAAHKEARQLLRSPVLNREHHSVKNSSPNRPTRDRHGRRERRLGASAAATIIQQKQIRTVGKFCRVLGQNEGKNLNGGPPQDGGAEGGGKGGHEVGVNPRPRRMRTAVTQGLGRKNRGRYASPVAIPSGRGTLALPCEL